MHIPYDTVVTRVTVGKERQEVPISQLTMDDRFRFKGRTLCLAVVPVFISSLAVGRRALRPTIGWYVVGLFGSTKVLFPLKDSQNPFSGLVGVGYAIPPEGQKVGALTFKRPPKK